MSESSLITNKESYCKRKFLIYLANFLNKYYQKIVKMYDNQFKMFYKSFSHILIKYIKME